MNNIRNRNVRIIFGGIGIAMLLCVLMLLMSWSAVVQNSDINAVETQSTEDDTIEIGEKNNFDFGDTQTSEGVEALGFDEDQEMLGMRTENTKTFYQDGNLEMMISNKPLHFQNEVGQLVDINTNLKATAGGYEIIESPTKLSFATSVDDGFIMELNDGVEIVSGINPKIVTISDGEYAMESEMFVDPRTQPVYLELETDFETGAPSIGGSSISYTLDTNSYLQYHSSANSVKQDLRIDLMSNDLRDNLEHISSLTDNTLYFGLSEEIYLPEGTGLFHNGQQLININERHIVDGHLNIVDIEANKVVAQIASPVSHDSSTGDEDVNNGNTVYFLKVDESGKNIELTTAVEYDWLVDENTNFPVVIDPSITNTYNTVSTGPNYYTCQKSAMDCFTSLGSTGTYRDGVFYYGSGGDHAYFPIIDFDITTGNSFTVKSITANIESDNAYTSASTAVMGLVVLEDCGGSEPDTTRDTLPNFANPSGCGAVI